MTIKDYKCKCGHDDFFFGDKGNQKGIYCSYCGKWLKWADRDEQNLRLKPLEQESSGDLISREKTLIAFADYVGSGMSMDDFDALWNIVARMPLVTPQPKTGHWIESDIPNEKYTCSECGGACWYYDYHGEVAKSQFCPNCGAKME